MKQTLLLFVTAVAISGLAQATLVSCTVNAQGPLTATSTPLIPFTNTAFDINSGNSGGIISGAITCPTINVGAGNIITGYTVIASADYELGPITGGTNEISLTYYTHAGAPIGATTTTATVTGGITSGNSIPLSPYQLGASLAPNTQTVNGFTVDVSSSVLMGQVASSSGQVAISYDTARATPEPASMALTGFALVGFGFLAKRKAAK